jgi:gamma-glutamylcyclotransferase (GGCT)/AIG2-like uncharacterized protein YtfP
MKLLTISVSPYSIEEVVPYVGLYRLNKRVWGTIVESKGFPEWPAVDMFTEVGKTEQQVIAKVPNGTWLIFYSNKLNKKAKA